VFQLDRGRINRTVALSFKVRSLPHHISADLSSTCRSYALHAIPLNTMPMTTRQAFDPDVKSMAAKRLAQQSSLSRTGE
jgi:hypothetical protein